jgi:hypothetical protein|tara:strand:+ start:1593 stop:2132 length:540 start_codon:yes stop_codon:yes gene_type:complete
MKNYLYASLGLVAMSLSINSYSLEIRPVGDNDIFDPGFEASRSTVCLDYIGAERNNDDLGIRSCIIDKPSQEWFIDRLFNSSYTISNGEGGCLDDLYSSNYVGVWNECHNKSNQRWYFRKVRTANVYTTVYIIESAEGNCLDLGSNGKLYAWKCHGKANQQWLVTDGGYSVDLSSGMTW